MNVKFSNVKAQLGAPAYRQAGAEGLPYVLESILDFISHNNNFGF
jgi:hypothetical protein